MASPSTVGPLDVHGTLAVSGAEKDVLRDGIIHDERLASALWEWWFEQPVADDDVSSEECAIGDIRALAATLDKWGFEIVRKTDA